MVTSPQFGQGKRTAPSPGIMVLEHQVQVGIRTVLVSLSFNAFFSYRAPVVVYLFVARGRTEPIRLTATANLNGFGGIGSRPQDRQAYLILSRVPISDRLNLRSQQSV